MITRRGRLTEEERAANREQVHRSLTENPIPSDGWRPDWTRDDLLEWARDHGVPLYGEDS